MTEPHDALFSRVEDKRHGKSRVALLSPAGNQKMLEEFISIIKKQSFQDFDILFIYPSGAQFYSTNDLSIINAEEKYALGSSGCFFAGQAFLYLENYEIIVLADLDAIPSSPDMLGNLISLAMQKQCACIPLSGPSDRKILGQYYVINQYGTIHRSVFERCGFATPYFWRGAEDWDLTQRLNELKLLQIVSSERIIHPLFGASVYSKLANRSKFYPYLSSLMKAFLLNSGFKNQLKYMCWYLFYSFFAYVFSDDELRRTIDLSAKFKLIGPIQGASFITVKNSGTNSNFNPGYFSRAISIFSALLSLIVNGQANVGSDTFSIPQELRYKIAINSIVALIICPYYLFCSIQNIFSWKNERKKVIYPIYPKDLNKASKLYQTYLEQKML